MEEQFSQLASLIGDPVRAKVLWALLDGRAYTATELSIYANTTPQNMSMHLHKLVKADLLTVKAQGRHRYYNYSRPDIAYVIEAMANLITPSAEVIKVSPIVQPVKFCRSCYDHLAGKVGILLIDSFLEQNILKRNGESFEVVQQDFFILLGIDIIVLKQQKRSFARACLDWSERKDHLGGALGAAILNKMLEKDWLRRTENSRAIVVTGRGREELLKHLKIEL